jgi:isopenicillin N synthase-like dioxygenase
MRANSAQIPIIDVSDLGGSSASAALRDVVADIGRACREVGFFYVKGHGVAPSLVDAAFARARAFFALPVAEKERISIRRSAHNRGYVAMQGEALDPSKPADLKEAFNLGLDLAADDPEVIAGQPFRGVNLWPDQPDFRETMLAYFDAAWLLGRQLHRAFALDLGLPVDWFEDKLDRPMATLRALHYPPRPASVAQGQLGAGEHTDYGNVTLLATDGVGGLEVRTRAGDWLAAPSIEGAFVCNIGDCLMRWTNDVYVSTPHRVNAPGQERYSIAFFLDPNPEAIVAALPTCVSADRPANYPPIRAADFLRSRLDPTYERAAAAKPQA